MVSCELEGPKKTLIRHFEVVSKNPGNAESLLRDAISTPLIEKHQHFKAGGTSPFLKADETTSLCIDYVSRPLYHGEPHYLDNSVMVGLPGPSNIEYTSSQEDHICDECVKNNYYPVLLKGTGCNRRLDHYSQQRMKNIFYHTQWNDLYLKYNEEVSFDDFVAFNKAFMDVILEIYQAGDRILIIDHDLWYLPELLKDKINASIDIFCRVPFPPVDVFRTLSHPKNIIMSMGRANSITFHCKADLTNFADSVSYLIDSPLYLREQSPQLCELKIGQWKTQLCVNRFGLDLEKRHNIFKSEEFEKCVEDLKNRYKGKKVIVTSANTLTTWTNVLIAFEFFLYKFGDNITLLNIEKSLTEGADFETLHMNYRISEYLRINYENSEILSLSPINDLKYFGYLAIADVGVFLDDVCAFDAGIIDYIISQGTNHNPLIISKLSNFGHELDCLKSISKDPLAIADELKRALLMSDFERENKYKLAASFIKMFDLKLWASNYRRNFDQADPDQKNVSCPDVDISRIPEAYKSSKKRVFFLDYDGTLVRLFNHPDDAVPTTHTLNYLKKFIDSGTDVWLVTGRGYEVCNRWFNVPGLKISAEHGSCTRSNNIWEFTEDDLGWIDCCSKVIQFFVDRTPGSFVEVKRTSLCYHYRNVNRKIANLQRNQLLKLLKRTVRCYKGVEVIDGKCVLEVRLSAGNKGEIVKSILGQNPYDFALSIGDDTTDEDMFESGNKFSHFHSIVVGERAESSAQYYVQNVESVYDLFDRLL